MDNHKEAVWDLAPAQCCSLVPARTPWLRSPRVLPFPAQGLAIPQALSSSVTIICIHSDGQIQQSFRIRSRSHVVHLFIDSTHVPGMRLDTENPAGTMELKLTSPQWAFTASLHLWPGLDPLRSLCFPKQPVFICIVTLTRYKSYFTNLFLISFQAGTVSHLSLYIPSAQHRAWVSIGLQSLSDCGNTTSHRLQMVIRHNNKYCKYSILGFNWYYFRHLVTKPGI